MIAIMSIIVLDVYPPVLSHPLRPILPYPSALPARSPIFLVDGISTHVLVYTTYALCIHTYIYIYIHMHVTERRHGKKKKKKYDARYIYVYVRVPFFRQERPTYG